MTLAFGSAKMKVRTWLVHFSAQLISAQILSYKYLLELESNFADSNQSDSEFQYDGNFTLKLFVMKISHRINWLILFPLKVSKSRMQIMMKTNETHSG